MARAVVRDVLDLAPDPEVALPRKSLVERVLDLVVDTADGADPAAVLRGGNLIGVEELTGATGHRGHPTDALSGHLHMP